ncbi:MAG: BlaI/MecI/CopY family transcriptional regulator [bacterium]|nr:BlaI/MecI/CopY family transcriptional regulator [bacterium]
MAKHTIPGFGELETAIMDVVWSTNPISVRDVLERLDRGGAYTTVMTVMQRLFDKGLLKRKLVDNAYQYEPAIPKEQFVEQTVRKTVDQLVNGFGNVALAHFVDALDDVDDKRLEKLRRRLSPRV